MFTADDRRVKKDPDTAIQLEWSDRGLDRRRSCTGSMIYFFTWKTAGSIVGLISTLEKLTGAGWLLFS